VEIDESEGKLIFHYEEAVRKQTQPTS